MADMTIKCEACGRVLTVSEYVDPESLKCACGQPLLPQTVTKPRAAPTLTTLRQKEALLAKPVEPKQGTKVRKRRPRRKRKTVVFKIARFQVSEYAISWLVFFILAPILGYLRFSDVFTEVQTKEDYIYYGMCACGLIYLVILIDAFNFEFFEGMLCLFVPPYTFYYLFFRSDSFALRALACAFTVGFGIDVALFLYQWSGDTMKRIQIILDPHTEKW